MTQAHKRQHLGPGIVRSATPHLVPHPVDERPADRCAAEINDAADATHGPGSGNALFDRRTLMRNGGRQRAPTARLDTVATVLAPDVNTTQALQEPGDLGLVAKVLVPVGQIVVSVEKRPLTLQIVVERQRMIVGEDWRYAADKSLSDPAVTRGAVQWKENVDEPLGPFQPVVRWQPAKYCPEQRCGLREPGEVAHVVVDDQHAARFDLGPQLFDGLFRGGSVLNDAQATHDVVLPGGEWQVTNIGLEDAMPLALRKVVLVGVDRGAEVH